MNTQDDKNKKYHHGSGRPSTKFMERPKPGKPAPSKSDDDESKDNEEEQYWGQGRQQKEGEDRQPRE